MPAEEFPRAGPLSNMALTWAGLIAAIGIGLLGSDAHPRFSGPVPPRLADGLLLSVVAMTVHKVESYVAREWEQCPFYLTMVRDVAGLPTGHLLFRTAVPLLVGAVALFALTVRGGPWPLLLCLAWLGQGLHEWHHLGKALSRRSWYPGVVTSVLFVGVVALAVWPAWARAVDLPPWAGRVYALAHPVALAAFWLEDRWWWPRYQRWRAAQAAA